jgi:hypothetical protein
MEELKENFTYTFRKTDQGIFGFIGNFWSSRFQGGPVSKSAYIKTFLIQYASKA